MRKLSCLLSLICLVWPALNQTQEVKTTNVPAETRPRPTSLVQKAEENLFKRTQAPIKQLDIDLIMLGPDFSGTAPSSVSWAGDNSKLWFHWKKPGEKEVGIYEVALAGVQPKRLKKSEEIQAPPPKASRDLSGRWAVYAFEGDIVLLDTHSGKLRKITETPDSESDPRLTRNGKQLVFRRGDNLFLTTLDGENTIRQLTDLRSGKDPEIEKKKKENEGLGKFLKEQQEELFRVLQNKAEKEREQEERKKSHHPQPLYIEDKKVDKLLLSPDEKYVAIEFSNESKEASLVQVPDYVTLSGYTAEKKSRIKVGDAQTRSSLMVLNLDTDLPHEIKLPGSSSASETSPETPSGKAESKSLPIDVFDALWSKEGHQLLATARSANNKDQWLLGINAGNNEIRTLNHEHDDAWILNDDDSPFTSQMEHGFLEKGHHVWFLSEQDGFRNLYTRPWEGGATHALAEGRFEIWDVMLSKEENTFYFRSNMEGPELMHFYALSAKGGVPQRLSTDIGNHQVILSPDESLLADIYSFSNVPWELYVQSRGNPKDRRALTDSPTPAFKSYPWTEPKLVKVRARDGIDVPARLYAPPKPRVSKPAVIFVHGAGYLQNVHRWWSSYYREYMFHHLLMERGYTVLDVDYRGSAGYGRDWRTAIYRHMGGKDLSDQVDAVDYLVKHHSVRPERVGIYGGSYGGFITLMALFTAPQSFGAGAALRPVTDWAHYNHPYSSNILNQPQDDAEAYRQSSPIYFAEGLQDPLLICHGLVDTNVHVQDTLRLVQRLVELRKPDFEVALYPVEDHAFKEASSWADEYKRIFRLFEQHLK